MHSVKDIIQDYNSVVKVIDKDASKQNNRAYGGVIRSVKGKLQEHIGGDYSQLPETIYGSKSTHSIMSYFEYVDLNIITLLRGERNINKPIHKNFKPLEENILNNAIKLMENELKKYL